MQNLRVCPEVHKQLYVIAPWYRLVSQSSPFQFYRQKFGYLFILLCYIFSMTSLMSEVKWLDNREKKQQGFILPFGDQTISDQRGKFPSFRVLSSSCTKRLLLCLVSLNQGYYLTAFPVHANIHFWVSGCFEIRLGNMGGGGMINSPLVECYLEF